MPASQHAAQTFVGGTGDGHGSATTPTPRGQLGKPLLVCWSPFAGQLLPSVLAFVVHCRRECTTVTRFAVVVFFSRCQHKCHAGQGARTAPNRNARHSRGDAVAPGPSGKMRLVCPPNTPGPRSLHRVIPSHVHCESGISLCCTLQLHTDTNTKRSIITVIMVCVSETSIGQPLEECLVSFAPQLS